MKSLNKYIAAMLLTWVAFACDNEEYKNDSTLSPSNPSVNIEIANSNVTLLEQDSTFQFQITLSTPQIVDVAVYVTAIDGTATEGEDFTLEGEVIIPANQTTGTAVVKINGDVISEDTETLVVQIGDDRTANAQISPKTVTFTINNVSETDLPLELSWAADYYDATGELVPATDVADMIFYVTDLAGNVELTENGTGFEEIVVTEALPDGEYLIKAGIKEAIDPGGLGNPPILDLSLKYSQVGQIDATTITLPGAFDTKLVCAGNLYTLAKIVKSGSSYTITPVAEAASVDVSAFVGAYDCEEPGYGVYTVNFAAGDQPGVIVNDNFWDSGVSIEYVLDVCGTVTIPNQSFTAGATYTVTGSGTYNTATGEIVVDYVVKSAAGATVDANTHTFTRP